MRRLNAQVEDWQLEALRSEASRRGLSLNALLRNLLDERYRAALERRNEHLKKIAGMFNSGGPRNSETIDEVLYGGEHGPA